MTRLDDDELLEILLAGMTPEERAELDEARADAADNRRAETDRFHTPRWVLLIEQAYGRHLEAQPREYWTERR